MKIKPASIRRHTWGRETGLRKWTLSALQEKADD